MALEALPPLPAQSLVHPQEPQVALEALPPLPAQSLVHPQEPQVALEALPPPPAQSLVPLQEPQAALEALPQSQESLQVCSARSPAQGGCGPQSTVEEVAGGTWHVLYSRSTSNIGSK